jgi:hypothetical protein
MNFIIQSLIRLGILRNDLDYHLLRALMVIICLFFGYQKWFDYEAQALIPYISHGLLIFWLHPVFGIRRATYFLGASEWLFGSLLLSSALCLIHELWAAASRCANGAGKLFNRPCGAPFAACAATCAS